MYLIHSIDYISSTIYCGLHPIHNIGYISSTLGSYHPIHIGFIIQTTTQFSSHPQYKLHLIHNICRLHLIHNIGYISSTLGSYHPIHIGFIIQTIVYISSTQFSSHPQYKLHLIHNICRLHLIHNIGYISSTLGSNHPSLIGFSIQTIDISSTQFSSHSQYMWTTSHLQYRLHLIHTSTV
jgi:hypothetical protein